jgi:hypothetical protein
VENQQSETKACPQPPLKWMPSVFPEKDGSPAWNRESSIQTRVQA